MTTGRPGLVVRGLHVSYGPVEAVCGVDLEALRGELVAVLGANGAGKSSLLGAIAGHVRPAAGTVEMDGRPCTGPPHRRARNGLAYVGDDRSLIASLTVQQSLRLVGASIADVAERFPQLVPLARRRAGLCSGGEQQILALARALASSPAALVVDELSLGLAPQMRSNLLQELRAVADVGTAVLVVEQHVEAVLAVADRAVLMHRGTIVDAQPADRWRGRSEELLEVMLA